MGLKIGIAGCTGRVGTLLIAELQNGPWQRRGLELAGGYCRNLPKDKKPDWFITDDAEALFKKSDCVIDFTLPEATMTHVALADRLGTTLIIGTTGLSAAQEDDLAHAAQNATIIYAANMSIGVNLILNLVREAASKLDPDWDIEIHETHHKHKIDAPSGTAIALGHAAAQGRSAHPESSTNDALYNHVSKEGPAFVFDREGKRVDGEIGFSVSRGGDVVGEHSVTFYSAGERVEIAHKATNRSLFAKGALKAALWSKGKSNGLYSMKDVLGLV